MSSPITRCTCRQPVEHFDREVCPCGSMHHFCECGRLTDPCDLDDVEVVPNPFDEEKP